MRQTFSALLAGISSLGAQFAKTRLGLKHLNLSKTSLSPKGVCVFLYVVYTTPKTGGLH